MLHFRKEIYTFFLGMKKSSPMLTGLLVAWAGIELLFVFVFPLVVPDSLYLDGYIPEKAKESTARFLQLENANIPDATVGWRNRTSFGFKTWQIDALGSRSTHPVDMANKARDKRAVFFGSSMVNGGEGVDNLHTISANIESEQLESLNFASMAFMVDQSYLLYQKMADSLKADYVVVGLDADPIDGLYNHYIPLRLHDEVGVPYLKPRFDLVNGQLQLVPVDLDWMKGLNESPAFVQFLQSNDRFYAKLNEYKHCAFTPLAHGMCWTANKVKGVLSYWDATARATDPLLEAILTNFRREAESHHAKAIFMVFPSERMFHWGGIWRYFPDVYAMRVEALQAKGFDVLDVRALFRASGLDSDTLFADDKHHFSAKGNQLVADGLLKHMTNTH